jgi:hypothetical protein
VKAIVTPNHAMQRTAGRFAARLNEELRIMKPKTLSPAVADLVFVRPFAMHRSNVTTMALAPSRLSLPRLQATGGNAGLLLCQAISIARIIHRAVAGYDFISRVLFCPG